MLYCKTCPLGCYSMQDMKRRFPGYYTLSPQGRGSLSRYATFTLDSNVLLNIYGLGLEARDAFLGMLRQLADQDRLWLTHQAGLEFQRLRPGKVLEQLVPSRHVRRALGKAHDEVQKELGNLNDHPFIDSSQILKSTRRLRDEITTRLEQQEREFSQRLRKDELREAIDELFENAVGPPYSREELSGIHKEGRNRYKERIPPGFGDAKEYGGKKDEPECYGDLVLWKQILDYAKETRRPVVLITEDRKKADWYWMVDPDNKDSELLGPHPKLVEEMLEVTGRRFHIARTAVFSKWMSKYLGRRMAPEVIEEIEEASLPTLREILTAAGQFVLRTQKALATLGSFTDRDLAFTAQQIQQVGILEAVEQQQRDVARSISPHITAAVDHLVQRASEAGLDKAVSELSQSIRTQLSLPLPPGLFLPPIGEGGNDGRGGGSASS